MRSDSKYLIRGMTPRTLLFYFKSHSLLRPSRIELAWFFTAKLDFKLITWLRIKHDYIGLPFESVTVTLNSGGETHLRPSWQQP